MAGDGGCTLPNLDWATGGNDYYVDDGYPWLPCNNTQSNYVSTDMCDTNKYMDSIEIKYDTGVTSIKFGCSELKDFPSSSIPAPNYHYV